jgi:DNA-binding IclR family transcriptional regulator
MPEISKTVDQALAVLTELAEAGPLTPTELAQRLHLNRTVVHRLLVTLHQRGFVARHEGGYVPGAAILQIADEVLPSLRAAATRVMVSLRDQLDETVVLYVADGNDQVVLHQCVAASHVLRVEHQIGSRSHLYLAASGLALLAFMPSAAVNEVARVAPDPDLLRQRLKKVRDDGYSLTHDEMQPGVYGLGVPVLDHTGHSVASLVVITPLSRGQTLLPRAEAIKTAAHEVSKALQGAPISRMSRESQA